MSCAEPPLRVCTGFETVPPAPGPAPIEYILLGAAGGFLFFALLVSTVLLVDHITRSITRRRRPR